MGLCGGSGSGGGVPGVGGGIEKVWQRTHSDSADESTPGSPLVTPSPSAISREEGEPPVNKVTPFLMFDDQLEAAMEFYTATFPDSEVRNLARTGKDGPITSAEFVVGGQVFMGYNGGPYFAFSEGFSLYVDCEDQAEVDEYWDKLVKAGASPTQCGWIKDPFGLSWQIVPKRFMQLIRDSDPRKVKAVMEAMMTMVKLDVAALERAHDEA